MPPFPGPGLAVRCLGEVTRQKLDTLREADAIVVNEITKVGFYRQTAQAFAVLLPVQSVGVMGDARTYESAVAIRCVDSADFMTADWSRLPYDLLASISTRIINEVPGVNRVTYDISSKPPATIEWDWGSAERGLMSDEQRKTASRCLRGRFSVHEVEREARL